MDAKEIKREYDRKRYLEKIDEISLAHKTYRENHKDEMSDYQRVYYTKYSDKKANSRLLRQYGITLDEYNKMFEEQCGCCAICGKHQSELECALCVDHNHETGEVRGLLCKPCNAAIGLFYDNRSLLENAIIYLEEGVL